MPFYRVECYMDLLQQQLWSGQGYASVTVLSTAWCITGIVLHHRTVLLVPVSR
jgi:hypothetical protein